jgi:hypothetical protein
MRPHVLQACLPLSEGARWWVDNNPVTYQELARRHRDSATRVD